MFGVLAAFLVVIVVVALSFMLIRVSTQSRWNTYSSQFITIDDKVYSVWVADTWQKQYQGLSDVRSREEMGGKAGMVFLFDVLQIQSFVNRRTYIDLEVVWMRDGRVVGRDQLPRLQSVNNREVVVSSPEPVDTVVELLR